MKQLTPFLVIGICIAMYFVYIKPELAVISQKRADYDKYRNVLDEVKNIKEIRDDLTAKYESISPDDLNKLDKIIPEKFDSVIFANDLSALASKHAVKMENLKMDYQKSNDAITDETQIGDNTYRVVTSTFHLVGDHDKFLAFLQELETSLRLVDVTRLSIKSAADTSNTNTRAPVLNANKNNLTYDVEIKTYSLK